VMIGPPYRSLLQCMQIVMIVARTCCLQCSALLVPRLPFRQQHQWMQSYWTKGFPQHPPSTGQSQNSLSRRRIVPFWLLSVSPMSSSSSSSVVVPDNITLSLASTVTEIGVDSDDTLVLPTIPIGGDYAGYVATYNANDGSFIPVPEHIIPDAMLEWGQQPSTLEVLTSEEISNINDNNDEQLFKRQINTLFPEIGCSIDNIETKKTLEAIKMSNIWQTNYNNIDNNMSTSSSADTRRISFDDEEKISVQQSLRKLAENKFSIETIFGWDVVPAGYRIRVKFDVMFSSNSDGVKGTITTPISIILERQVSKDSTGGTIADGGGLDGRRVANMIGPILQKYSDFPNHMTGTGTSTIRTTSLGDNSFIQFPGTNITLTSFYENENNLFVIDVGQIMTTVAIDDINERNDTRLVRYHHHIVRRKFKSSTYDSCVESIITELS
jgi:hypothetical protein